MPAPHHVSEAIGQPRLNAQSPLPSRFTPKMRASLAMQADVTNDVAHRNLLAYSLEPKEVLNGGQSLY